MLRGTTPLEERFLGNANIMTDDAKAELLRVSADEIAAYQKPFEIARRYYDRTRHLDPVSRMQYIDMNLWMPGDILMKADKLTMAHSLELRVPFLDRKVFDVARTIPASYRIAEKTTKYALRKAMEGIIPDSVLHRPKLGFLSRCAIGCARSGPASCGRSWLRAIDPLVNLSAVEEMFTRHRNGQGDYSRKIWVLYVFGLWYRTYMRKQ